MAKNEITKYSGELIHLIYKQGGDLSIPGDEILSLECVVAGTTYMKNLHEIEVKLEKEQCLDLVREPDNKYDTFAIAIYNSNKEKLGYIPRDKNEMLARLMVAGKWFYAKVHDKLWEGNWLKIDLEIYLKE
ncbi:MAG: HIRAN domain-containing protein [Tannerella sp.]|nr:HIRAN domain-containing protein [Tannerella sp.]